MNRSKLKVHVEAVHEGKKPYQCDFCQKAFARKPCLKKHMKKCNVSAGMPEKLGMPATADMLEIEGMPEKAGMPKKAGMPEMHEMTDHMSSLHEENMNFACNLCGTVCVNKSKLKVHVEAVHEGKKPYQCDFCEKAFSRKFGLQKHIINLQANAGMPEIAEEMPKMAEEMSEICQLKLKRELSHSSVIYVKNHFLSIVNL